MDHPGIIVALLLASGWDIAPMLPPVDFVEYWSAAREHLRGGNPYDGDALLPWQRLASGDQHKATATMLWTPPWTLPLYWPFAFLPPNLGHAAWLVMQLSSLLLSISWLSSVYLPVCHRGLRLVFTALLAVAFAPSWWMMNFGQNTGFILLGLAGFLKFRLSGRPGIAGGFAALTAIKPHLLALFGVVLILDAIRPAGRKTLIVGVAVLSVCGLVALLPNPQVYADFFAAVRRPPTATSTPLWQWQLPSFSYWFRITLEERLAPEVPGSWFSLQFLPCLLGMIAVIPYYCRRRDTWDWLRETPRLVLASVVLAPYGSWIFDLTVLAVPLIQAASWMISTHHAFRIVVWCCCVIFLSLATAHRPWVTMLHDLYWYAPLFLGLYVLAGILSRDRTRLSPDKSS
jgi:hypothetical protein